LLAALRAAAPPFFRKLFFVFFLFFCFLAHKQSRKSSSKLRNTNYPKPNAVVIVVGCAVAAISYSTVSGIAAPTAATFNTARSRCGINRICNRSLKKLGIFHLLVYTFLRFRFANFA